MGDETSRVEAESVEQDEAPVAADAETGGAGLVEDEVDAPAQEPVADARVAELEATIQTLQTRLRTVSAAFHEQQDEIAAIRSRLERQAAVEAERRRGEVVGVLFEPAQNLRRSLDAMRKAGVQVEFISGLEIVVHQIMNAFHSLGLEEVPGKGAKFNPSLHEALTSMPVADPALDNVVMEVFSVGYRIGSRLIAPARVVIGQYQEPAGEA